MFSKYFLLPAVFMLSVLSLPLLCFAKSQSEPVLSLTQESQSPELNLLAQTDPLEEEPSPSANPSASPEEAKPQSPGESEESSPEDKSPSAPKSGESTDTSQAEIEPTPNSSKPSSENESKVDSDQSNPDTSTSPSNQEKLLTDEATPSTETEEVQAPKTLPIPPPQEDIEVEFYRPEEGDTKKSGRTRVLVSGKTLPGAIVWIGGKTIPYITSDQKIKRLKLKDVLVSPRKVRADSKGFFVFNFDFPRENIQLTVKIAKPKSKVSQSFQLNLGITKEEIKVTNQTDLKVSPLYSKRYALWFGTGFNFLRYQQESTDIQSSLEFQTFKGPSFFGRGWWKVNDRLDASFEAKMSPGAVNSSNDIRIAGGDYNWLIFAAEGTYYPERWTHKLFEDYPSRWGIRTGIQHHLVPFISRTGASESEAEIVINNITMFTIGFQNNIDLSSRWAFEWYMRYQSPLAVGNVFQMLPKFGFDGSLGVIRAIRSSWKLGLFWYGQWHDYDFTHNDRYLANQADPNSRISGHQSLFFSNIELRAGYEFN